MKFQLGDLVVLKHTGSEGRIVGLEDNDMFLVHIDGVDIPVFKENIDHPYFDWFTSDKEKKKSLKNVTIDQVPKEASGNRTSMNWPQGVYLALFPVFSDNDEDIEKFKVYFINQDSGRLSFGYRCALQDTSIFSLKGDVLPYTNFYIHNIVMEDMHGLPVFSLKIYPFNDSRHTSQTIKIRPKKLFQFIEQIRRSDISFVHLPLDYHIREEDHPDDIRMSPVNAIQQNIQAHKKITEIDLHIEKIQPDYYHLSNAEIVQLQLACFEKALQHAISLNQDHLTVIHGVGKGVLKEEIHEMLRMYKEVRHFVSDWSPRYGNGATQIFLYT